MCWGTSRQVSIVRGQSIFNTFVLNVSLTNRPFQVIDHQLFVNDRPWVSFTPVRAPQWIPRPVVIVIARTTTTGQPFSMKLSPAYLLHRRGCARSTHPFLVSTHRKTLGCSASSPQSKENDDRVEWAGTFHGTQDILVLICVRSVDIDAGAYGTLTFLGRIVHRRV